MALVERVPVTRAAASAAGWPQAGEQQVQVSAFCGGPVKHAWHNRGGKPALTMNVLGRSKTYFSATWQFDMAFIRRLVKEAGAFVYADGEDPLEANDAFVALHARNAGRKVIRLPRKVHRVVDMFARKLVASDTDTFSFDARIHESFLFYYGD